jgi:hypothetical protein
LYCRLNVGVGERSVGDLSPHHTNYNSFFYLSLTLAFLPVEKVLNLANVNEVQNFLTLFKKDF